MRSAYQYTLLRYVHDVATGEFVNVGVVVYAPELRFANALCRTTYRRLSAAFPGLDGEAFRRLMRLIEARLAELGARLVSELPLDPPKSILNLVHEVLPPDDSSLQWSPVGGGVTQDPSKTLDQLYRRLVAKYDEKQPTERRDDDDVWRSYKKQLESHQVLKHLKAKKIVVQDDEVEFAHAWKNGVWHCLEPLSFDLATPDSIRDKAHKLLGRMLSVKEAAADLKLYLLLGEPRQEELRPAFDKALRILKKLPVANHLVREADAAAFTEKLAADIQDHVGNDSAASIA